MKACHSPPSSQRAYIQQHQHPYHNSSPRARHSARKSRLHSRDYDGDLLSTGQAAPEQPQPSVLLVLDDGFCLLSSDIKSGSSNEVLSARIWQKARLGNCAQALPVEKRSPCTSNASFDAKESVPEGGDGVDKGNTRIHYAATQGSQTLNIAGPVLEHLKRHGSLQKSTPVWPQSPARTIPRQGQGNMSTSSCMLCCAPKAETMQGLQQQQHDISSHTSSELSFQLAKAAVTSPPSPVWKAGKNCSGGPILLMQPAADDGCLLDSTMWDHGSIIATCDLVCNELQTRAEGGLSQTAQEIGTASTSKSPLVSSMSPSLRRACDDETTKLKAAIPNHPNMPWSPLDQRMLQKWGTTSEELWLTDDDEPCVPEEAHRQRRLLSCCSVHNSDCSSTVTYLKPGSVCACTPNPSKANSLAKLATWDSSSQFNQDKPLNQVSPQHLQPKSHGFCSCAKCTELNSLYQAENELSCSEHSSVMGSRERLQSRTARRQVKSAICCSKAPWMKTKRTSKYNPRCDKTLEHSRSRVWEQSDGKENENPQIGGATVEQYSSWPTNEASVPDSKLDGSMKASSTQCCPARCSCGTAINKIGMDHIDEELQECYSQHQYDHHHLHTHNHHHHHPHPHPHPHPQKEYLHTRDLINKRRGGASTVSKSSAKCLCKLCDQFVRSTRL